MFLERLGCRAVKIYIHEHEVHLKQSLRNALYVCRELKIALYDVLEHLFKLEEIYLFFFCYCVGLVDHVMEGIGDVQVLCL